MVGVWGWKDSDALELPSETGKKEKNNPNGDMSDIHVDGEGGEAHVNVPAGWHCASGSHWQPRVEQQMS